MIRFTSGDVRLAVLDGGSLWLDGGAMFGIVPKVLWSMQREPDDENRIRLAMNLLLIEDGERRILVDTGAGTHWDDRSRRIYRIEPKSASEILEPAGLVPAQIDLVVNTHLHFDHAGGNAEATTGGDIRAAYPNARYVVQRGELDTARWRNERTRGSYVSQNFEPLAEEDGRLWLVEGETDLSEVVRLRVAPGHTPHMQVVTVATGEGTVAYLADLVPTSSHLAYPYIMGYDLEPLVTLETKKRLLPEAAREGWVVVFGHDDSVPVGVVAENDGQVEARPWNGKS